VCSQKAYVSPGESSDVLRREALALCGAGLAALAGCSSGGNGGSDTTTAAASRSPTPTPTPTETGTPTATPPERDLTVELDALQPALVESNVDYFRLVAEANRQYLALTVAVDSGPPLARSALAFRFDGAEHAPKEWERVPARGAGGSDDQYSAESGAGWLVFDLPETGDASDAALVWSGGEWRVDDRLREQLAAPLPALSLAQWRAPETAPLDSTTTFELAVRNEDDQTGWFVGAINAAGWYPHRPIARVSRRIPAGETVSWDVRGEDVDLPEEGWAENVGDGEPDVEYELVWPDGSERRSVRVVEK
jgi:hypothetical protein